MMADDIWISSRITWNTFPVELEGKLNSVWDKIRGGASKMTNSPILTQKNNSFGAIIEERHRRQPLGGFDADDKH